LRHHLYSFFAAGLLTFTIITQRFLIVSSTARLELAAYTFALRSAPANSSETSFKTHLFIQAYA